MITGLNLFHLVEDTPTNLSECPGASDTLALAEPPSIDSPVLGNILMVAVVSFNKKASNPVAQSGNLTHSAELAVADVTMLYDAVNAVAAPCVVPAADTAAEALKVDEPPTLKLLVRVSVEPAIVPTDMLSDASYLAVLRLVKLASTSLLVNGLPFDDLNVIVAIYLSYVNFLTNNSNAVRISVTSSFKVFISFSYSRILLFLFL